jgi:SAM-dependent methyltransferase
MKLYRELARWWPLFSSPHDDDYRDEANFFRSALNAHCVRPLNDVLELGCGGGNIASYLKANWKLTLSDVSPEMLDVSRRLNPECEHVEGDMRTLRLGRTFDAVFVHDAVCYITTQPDLESAMRTAFVHCRNGGAALFAPDCTREGFQNETSHGGEDGEGESLRYLSWTFDPYTSDSTYNELFSLILRTKDGSVHFDHDEHTLGLFSRAEWIATLTSVGFAPTMIEDPWHRDIFIGERRPL